MKSAAVLALGVCAVAAFAQELPPEQRQQNLAAFDQVARTIAERHWSMPAGLDWNQAAADLRPKVEAAKSMKEARAAMSELIGRLGQSHFNIVPADVYSALGDAVNPGRGGEGQPGFDVRVIDDRAVVVAVEGGSPAEQAGVRPGWIVAKAGADDIPGLLAKAAGAVKEPGIRGLVLPRVVLSRLSGPAGSAQKVEFLDGNGQTITKEIKLIPPRGNPARFGYLPNMHVWFESKKLGNAGYTRWNMFMDAPTVMARFADAASSCMNCDGFIIDLRGNPGGIGAMAMGIAGWFIPESGRKLGVMKTRETEVKFVVIPRAQVFKGPLAILVDEGTASTSEILAGGLKDLGRARIFGSRTAGAALPSVFEKLPNGDGFQYAVANYISEGGRALEGEGVSPDVPVKLTREALLAGRDPALDAALAWIKERKKEP